MALPSLPPISPLRGSTSAPHRSRPCVLAVVGPRMDVPRGGQGWEDGRRKVVLARKPELHPISAPSRPPLPSASSSASRGACGMSGEGRSRSGFGVWGVGVLGPSLFPPCFISNGSSSPVRAGASTLSTLTSSGGGGLRRTVGHIWVGGGQGSGGMGRAYCPHPRCPLAVRRLVLPLPGGWMAPC